MEVPNLSPGPVSASNKRDQGREWLLVVAVRGLQGSGAPDGRVRWTGSRCSHRSAQHSWLSRL